MIIKEPMPWIRMLLSVKGSSLTRTYSRILIVTLISVVVTWIERRLRVESYTLTTTPFTVIGLALGIFLGFRNNAAYDRFWEGRKLWGQLVNSSRSFSRQVLTLVRPHSSQVDTLGVERGEVEAFQKDLVRHAIAFVHSLRHSLRDTDPFEDLARFLPEPELTALRGYRNVPFAVSTQMASRVRLAWDRGWISAFHLPVMEKTLAILTDIQGGCERIKLTPIPWAYTVLLHRLVAFYCLFLPFGIVEDVGWLTPVVVLLISHAFFGLDEIGNELEQPFGIEAQDLPLDSISRTIEVNLLQAIGSTEVPDLLRPVDGILT